MDRQIILLVDDKQTHQYSLGRHLEESGFDVMQAQSGSEAPKMAAARRPGAACFLNYPINIEHLVSVLQGAFLHDERTPDRRWSGDAQTEPRISPGQSRGVLQID